LRRCSEENGAALISFATMGLLPLYRAFKVVIAWLPLAEQKHPFLCRRLERLHLCFQVFRISHAHLPAEMSGNPLVGHGELSPPPIGTLYSIF